jgi:hypothetical protein
VGDEFCEKARPRSLAHDFNGLVQPARVFSGAKVGNAAEALGSRLSAQMGSGVREGDYLLNYAHHSSGNFLRVIVAVPGDGAGGDGQAVALGRALAGALRPLGEYSSRSASLPRLPD